MLFIPTVKRPNDVRDREPMRPKLRATSWSVGVTFLVVLVVPICLKAIKVYNARIDLGWFAALSAFIPDCVVALAVASLMLIWCRLGGQGRWGRWIYWTVSGIVLSVIIALSTLEHQVWTRTSTLIDWSILSYTVRHYDDLAAVVASESNWFGQALLMGAALLGLTPLAVDSVVTRVVCKALFPTKRYIGLSILLFGVVGAASLVLSVPSELYALSKPVAVSLIAEALTPNGNANSTETSTIEIPPDQSVRMVQQTLDRARIKHGNKKDHPKNFLYVILESTRFDASSVYFPELRTTPSQEALANHAAVVQRVYVDMPHTSKALVTLLCGKAPRFSFEINESQIGGIPTPCVAHVLNRLGYRTGFFQSATGTFENRGQLVENAGYKTFMAQESYENGRFEKANYLSTEDKIMVGPVLEWIDKNPKRPFFATVLTATTHHKYETPSSFNQTNLSRQFTDRAPIPSSSRKFFKQYLNAVRYSDEMLGGIIDGLKKRDLLDDTLVVVVGDHGQGFEEHGPKYHNDVIYEEGIRVPLIFSNPRVFPEKQWVTGLRRQVDIAPTALALLNIEFSESLFDGRDVLRFPGHDRVYSTCWYDRRCMSEIEDHLKTIYHFDHKSMEVFDLRTDPLEQINLLRVRGDRKQYKRAADQAKKRIETYLAEMQDRFRLIEGKQPWLLSEEPKPRYPLPVQVEDVFELIGFDAPTLEAQPGKMWEANLYFRCLKPSEPGWRLFYRLKTVDGRRVQTDYFPANARFDLTECTANKIVVDQLRVWIPEDFPPGPVSLFWGSVYLKYRGPKHVSNPRLEWRKLIPRKRGILIRYRGVLLARLNVNGVYRPELAHLLEQSVLTKKPQIPNPQGVRFGDSLVLEQFEVQPKRVPVDGAVMVSTLWRVDGKVAGKWKFFTHIISEKNQKYVGEKSSTAVQGLHPIANWRTGTWIKDSFVVNLPKNAPPGNLQLRFGIYQPEGRMEITNPGKSTVDTENRVSLGTVSITK